MDPRSSSQIVGKTRPSEYCNPSLPLQATTTVFTNTRLCLRPPPLFFHRLFKSLHPPNAIQENLAPSKQVGIIDPSDVKSLEEPETEDEKRISQAREAMMGVSGMINLDDFEELAHKILSPTALAYYASGSDDELTMHENRDAYRRIKFRPRVMRKVRDVDPSTEILGVKSSLPIFIAPAALAKVSSGGGLPFQWFFYLCPVFCSIPLILFRIKLSNSSAIHWEKSI